MLKEILEVYWMTLMIKGKKSGPPPKSGPNPQGLNIKYNTVKTTTISEKINGNNRQVFTQRGKEGNKHS